MKKRKDGRVYSCGVCRRRFHDERSWANHQESDGHKLNVKRLQDAKAFLTSYGEEVAKPSSVMAERQIIIDDPLNREPFCHG